VRCGELDEAAHALAAAEAEWPPWSAAALVCRGLIRRTCRACSAQWLGPARRRRRLERAFALENAAQTLPRPGREAKARPMAHEALRLDRESGAAADPARARERCARPGDERTPVTQLSTAPALMRGRGLGSCALADATRLAR
jgi:hypothetical protein